MDQTPGCKIKRKLNLQNCVLTVAQAQEQLGLSVCRS